MVTQTAAAAAAAMLGGSEPWRGTLHSPRSRPLGAAPRAYHMMMLARKQYSYKKLVNVKGIKVRMCTTGEDSYASVCTL